MTSDTRAKELVRVGDTVLVPLTKGYTAVVDVEDIDLVKDNLWSACIVGRTGSKRVYAVRSVMTSRGRRLEYMHRLIAGASKGDIVDHSDRNTLNNRRANLRPCSMAENNRNIGARSDSPLGVKGVFPDNRRGGFRASLRKNGKTLFQGHFATVEAATAAYNEAAARHFGDFAYLNAAVRNVE